LSKHIFKIKTNNIKARRKAEGNSSVFD